MKFVLALSAATVASAQLYGSYGRPGGYYGGGAFASPYASRGAYAGASRGAFASPYGPRATASPYATAATAISSPYATAAASPYSPYPSAAYGSAAYGPRYGGGAPFAPAPAPYPEPVPVMAKPAETDSQLDMISMMPFLLSGKNGLLKSGVTNSGSDMETMLMMSIFGMGIDRNNMGSSQSFLPLLLLNDSRDKLLGASADSASSTSTLVLAMMSLMGSGSGLLV